MAAAMPCLLTIEFLFVVNDRDKGQKVVVTEKIANIKDYYCSQHIKRNVANKLRTGLDGAIHTISRSGMLGC